VQRVHLIRLVHRCPLPRVAQKRLHGQLTDARDRQMRAALEIPLGLLAFVIGIIGGQAATTNVVQSITASRALFAGGLSGACQVGCLDGRRVNPNHRIL